MQHTRSMFWLAAGAAAVCAGMAMSRNARARRLRSRSRPEPLNRWENEGGAVPVDETRTAAQVSPMDGPTTAESYGDETYGSSNVR